MSASRDAVLDGALLRTQRPGVPAFQLAGLPAAFQ